VTPQNDSLGSDPRRDELLATLNDPYCRFVLCHIRDASEAVASVERLSTAFAREHGVDTDQAAVRLHHTALPKLSDVGVLDYDARSNTVRYYSHSLLDDWEVAAD